MLLPVCQSPVAWKLNSCFVPVSASRSISMVPRMRVKAAGWLERPPCTTPMESVVLSISKVIPFFASVERRPNKSPKRYWRSFAKLGSA